MLVVVWLLYLAAGAQAPRLYPYGLLFVALMSALLTAISLALYASNPAIDRAALFAPLSIIVNYAAKFLIGGIFFLIGYGFAKWRASRATRAPRQ